MSAVTLCFFYRNHERVVVNRACYKRGVNLLFGVYKGVINYFAVHPLRLEFCERGYIEQLFNYLVAVVSAFEDNAYFVVALAL